jgi:hypothetical protein
MLGEIVNLKLNIKNNFEKLTNKRGKLKTE